MSSPRISIVTAVLNEAGSIERTFDSVRMQTLSPAEHIIVDGGSTDGTLELAARYAAPGCVIQQTSEGLYAAINEGLRATSGDVVGLLHANDEYSSTGVLQAVSEIFAADDEVQLLFADIVYKRPDGTRGRRYSGRRFTPAALLDGFMPPHPSVYVRRKSLTQVGYYREDMRIAADFDWLVRALLRHRLPWRYLPMEMVDMSAGGISGRLANRLWHTPHEKWLSLRHNGYHVSPLRLIKRYFHIWD